MGLSMSLGHDAENTNPSLACAANPLTDVSFKKRKKNSLCPFAREPLPQLLLSLFKAPKCWNSSNIITFIDKNVAWKRAMTVLEGGWFWLFSGGYPPPPIPPELDHWLSPSILIAVSIASHNWCLFAPFDCSVGGLGLLLFSVSTTVVQKDLGFEPASYWLLLASLWQLSAN